MRQLKDRVNAGFTLLELCIVMAIIGILASVGIPNLSDYMANARLREAGNLLVSTALFARSEAIKRNADVRLDNLGQTLNVRLVDTAGVVTLLRTRPLPQNISATAFQADFNGAGQLTPFGSQVNVALSSAARACGGDIRCPSALIESGGAVSQCFTSPCP